MLLPSLSIGDHSWILDLDGWRSCEVRNLTSSSYQETSRRFYDVPAMNILNFAYSKRHINYTVALEGVYNYVYIIRNDIISSSCARFLFSFFCNNFGFHCVSKCVTMTSTSHSASPAAAAGDTQKKQGGYGKIKTHKESKLSQLSRLDEVFAALTLLYVKVIFYIYLDIE